MIRFIGWYIVGLVVCLMALKDVILSLNTMIFHATPVSLQANDAFLLIVRIFLSYLFGSAYFYFKIQKSKIDIRTRDIIFSMLGLIILLIVIDLIQVFITLKILSKEKIFMRSILSLWITFPCIILYFAMLLKYGYKRSEIKWFW